MCIYKTLHNIKEVQDYVKTKITHNLSLQLSFASPSEKVRSRVPSHTFRYLHRISKVVAKFQTSGYIYTLVFSSMLFARYCQSLFGTSMYYHHRQPAKNISFEHLHRPIQITSSFPSRKWSPNLHFNRQRAPFQGRFF
jgi:hypothetical protein